MKPSSSLSLFAAAFLVLALVAGACSSDPSADDTPNAGQSDDGSDEGSGSGGSGGDEAGGDEGGGDAPTTAAAQGATVRIDEERPQGDTEILITLEEAAGTDDPGVTERETTVAGDPLADADVERLLNRLPELEAEATDQVEFNRPPDTRPRPRPGDTVEAEFPPPAEADAPDTATGPLEVLRFQPEGPVDLAPFISVTFNQPMVALSTVSQVEAADVPITITPEMPGRWIWLGARTVRFEYEPGAIDRIPAATNYTVEIPAGTESATGGELAETVTFDFSTPTPRVLDVVPMSESLSTEPLFFVRFDQRVDADAVLDTIAVLVDGDEVEIRLADDDEISQDTDIADLVEGALPGRWIAFRPVEPLPTDAAVQLDVGPNVPSAEGPETSSDVSSHFGRTYGRFRVVDSGCGYGDGCRPGSPFMIQLSNPIDTESFSAEMVRVEPAIPGLQIGVSYDRITVQGRTAGRTEYQVTLSADLADIYGQRLGDPATAEFRVGDAQPALFRPGRSLVTLDPMVDDGALNVTSINNDELELTIYRVDPAEDWQGFVENQWELSRGEYRSGWDVIAERTVAVGGERNDFAETALDLSSELEESSHLVVVVSPTERRDDDWQNEPFAVWVQRTRLGLDASTDNATAVAWVTDLTTGEPVEGADVQILGGESGTTDADGTTRLDLPNRSRGLLAELDGDSALIGDFWSERWDRNDQLRWFILDDRGLYKPGETARIKGWVRQADVDVPADLSLPDDGGTVFWYANDAFGNEIGTGEVELSPLGGFDLELELPTDITLGYAGIRFTTDAFGRSDNGDAWHELQVQEFRRPDFEVTAEVTDDGPYLAGNTFSVAAQADYFAGGAIASSPVEWTVSGRATSYSPPNWPEYTFGVWVPWWFFSFNEFGDSDFGGFGPGFGDVGTTEYLSAVTSSGGGHDLAVTVETEGKPRPVSVTASATVTDVTRQPITGTATALVHPADRYVGVRGDRTFVRAGEQLDLQVIVTDIDGEAVSGQDVTVESVRLEWQFQGGTWTEVEVPDETCDTTSESEAVVCSFRPSEGGRYRMTATVTDADGRTNLTELTRWVAGGDRPTSRRVDLEQLTLVPSGQDFQPGDTAEILVQSPFVDAHGLLVVSRGAIDRTETFEFDENGAAVVRVPITSDDIPGIGLQFEVVGTAPRSVGGETDDAATSDAPARPAFAAGQLTLNVPPDERALTIDVAPRLERLEPGADTQVDVAVTGPDGEPVEGAELTVIVVDEAVLSLSGYQLGDPLDAFYPNNGSYVQAFRGRTSLLLSDPDTSALGGDGEATASAESAADDSADAGLDAAFDRAEESDFAMADGDESARDGLQAAPAPAAAQGSGNADQPAIELRTNFDALAVFEPEVTTDADGKAVIAVPLPDNLTRYRVMVVATAEATDAGSGESNITARLPITVRPTPPRFANFGDVFEFPVIVQNATDDDVDVDVALRSTNLAVDGRAGTTVTVPANDRVEVRFEVSAVEAGTARYQIAASAGDFTDAAEGEFPVYTPATSEAFATYGVVDSGSIAQPFSEPQDVFPQFGGLEITTSSTAVSALTDAVIYTAEYRYDHSDAFASRIIAITSLDDILSAFEAPELPSPDELRSVVNNDIDRLSSMQNDDGGFPYWRRGRESIPYNTVQATHALILAEREGFAVDEQVLLNAKFYLANIEDHYPSWYSPETRRAISAYALHVRLLGGDRDSDKATSLYRSAGDDIEIDVAAWLWPVLADTELDDDIELLLNNRVTETPNGATFTTSYGEQDWVLLYSDRRTDAIVLDALISQRPDSDLVLKTLNGLLAARSRYGWWGNIQENSFVLLAGGAYFETYEGVDPDFIARAWLGDTYAVEQSYVGRSTDNNLTIVPMSELVDVGDTDIVLERDGSEGRLYYRLGLRYAPTDFDLAPRDQGFVVQRTYEAVDDEGDVVQNDDGTWTVQAGARVRVRLTMVADSRRTHVALIDPIPAGFEIVNPALATSEPVPQADPSEDVYRGYWWYRWFDHQNLRDDRAEAFSTYLGAGSYEYTYVARATTPGTFVTPPARAEQMYEPEVFGRSASTTVTVSE